VLAILERRAADEANLIFRRHREEGGKRSFTEISNAISVEINARKAELFAFFEANPGLWSRPQYRAALLAHLPRLVRERPELAARIERLPSKYRSAILAAEIGTAMVYRRPLAVDFATAVDGYVATVFASA
jgi:glutamate dehydrogenase